MKRRPNSALHGTKKPSFMRYDPVAKLLIQSSAKTRLETRLFRTVVGFRVSHVAVESMLRYCVLLASKGSII